MHCALPRSAAQLATAPRGTVRTFHLITTAPGSRTPRGALVLRHRGYAPLRMQRLTLRANLRLNHGAFGSERRTPSSSAQFHVRVPQCPSNISPLRILSEFLHHMSTEHFRCHFVSTGELGGPANQCHRILSIMITASSVSYGRWKVVSIGGA